MPRRDMSFCREPRAVPTWQWQGCLSQIWKGPKEGSRFWLVPGPLYRIRKSRTRDTGEWEKLGVWMKFRIFLPLRDTESSLLSFQRFLMAIKWVALKTLNFQFCKFYKQCHVIKPNLYPFERTQVQPGTTNTPDNLWGSAKLHRVSGP